jgi:hypothetical protein
MHMRLLSHNPPLLSEPLGNAVAVETLIESECAQQQPITHPDISAYQSHDDAYYHPHCRTGRGLCRLPGELERIAPVLVARDPLFIVPVHAVKLIKVASNFGVSEGKIIRCQDGVRDQQLRNFLPAGIDEPTPALV